MWGGGSTLNGRRGLRGGTLGRVAPEGAPDEVEGPSHDPARHHAVAEEGDQGREQGGRGEDRDGDDGHRPQRHRAQGLVVDHPEAGEGDDHREAGEGDREARGRERPVEGLLVGAAGVALLSVAGEDEQRVVDRDPDPDHRGHVGDEHRGRHLQRDEVDERAGDDDADEPQRQRQRRRGERAEDDEEDDRDDREAADLGFGEVFLGELLEPGPDRRLAGEVGGHPVLSGPRVEIGAEVPRGVDLIVGAELAAQRHQRRPGALEFLRPRAATAGGSVTLSTSETASRTRATAAAPAAGGGTRLGAQDDADPVGVGSEVTFERLGHRLRLAARDVEPAPGQVFGLAGGEGEGEEEDDGPGHDHRATVASQETGESDHHLAHWLPGQPAAGARARL